jgi:hypothetical protein
MLHYLKWLFTRFWSPHSVEYDPTIDMSFHDEKTCKYCKQLKQVWNNNNRRQKRHSSPKGQEK